MAAAVVSACPYCSIAARLNDCEAKLLFTADGFYRRGQVVPMKQTADEAVKLSPTVHHVVVVRRLPAQTGLPAATNAAQADGGTIRGDLAMGFSNVIHCSDSVETAKQECSLFFAESSSSPQFSRISGST